ncbi:hypothetical protein QET93_010020 [Akkermansia sp. N21116]|uniref:hypothetical protein n=1 Tax=Akkermansia sp. N21116 TaxID=3040764 RepID=UPI00244EB5ED|nr:hypothetical protein [Akkermansia sp. N21116]WPX39873.1 hypothetical protein QET93_010020 [Akkermansia sp. N21116]
MSDQPDSQPNPPLLKKRTLITGVPAGGQSEVRPKLFSPATAAQAASQGKLLTPGGQAQITEEQALLAEEQLRLQQEELARQAAEQAERERLDAEQAAQKRLEAEQIAAAQAEEERLEIERAAAERTAYEQAIRDEQEKLAAAQTAEEAQPPYYQGEAPQAEELDAKVKHALEQLKAAQEALIAAQATATSLSPSVSAAPAPAPESSPGTAPRLKLATPASLVSAAPSPSPAITPKPVATSSPLPGTPASPSLSGGSIPPTAGIPQSPDASSSAPQPESIMSKKPIKFGIIAVCIAAIGCGAAYYYVSGRDEAIRKANARYTELQKIGVELGKESSSLGADKGGDILKYDAATFKTKVTPNAKDADFLLDHIRGTKDPTGAKAAIHLLSVMGQLDPKIALKTITDITNNPKKYTKTQISMFTSILASSKNPKVLQHLWLLQRKLAAANQKELEATVLREMRLGLDPNSITPLLKLLFNPDTKVTDSHIVDALATAIPSMADKADDAGKSLIAEEIVKAANSAPKDTEAKRLNIAYQALALTGKPMAISFFRDTVKNSPLINKITAIRAMKSCVSDDAIPLLREFMTWKDPDLERESTVREIRNSISSVLGNRLGQRSNEEGKALFQPEIDRINDLSAQAAAAPDDKKLAQAAQDAKMMILATVSIAIEEYPYVKDILDQFIKDTDPKVSERAKNIRKLIANRKNLQKERKGMSEEEKAAYWQNKLNQ